MNDTTQLSANDPSRESGELDSVFEFYIILRHLTRIIESYRDSNLKEVGLTGAQFYAIWTVHKLKECTYTELAQHSGLATNSVSPLAKSLVEQRLLLQVPDPCDGRVTRLRLSEVRLCLVRNVVEVMDNPRVAAFSQALLMVQEGPCDALSALRNLYSGFCA